MSDDKRIKIFDTTLRDGEQSPGCSMTRPEKLRVAQEQHDAAAARQEQERNAIAALRDRATADHKRSCAAAALATAARELQQAMEQEAAAIHVLALEQEAAQQARAEATAACERQLRAEQEAALLEERVARTPLAEEKLAALEQRLGVLRDTYVSNLRKVEAAELAKSVESAQQGARVEVLDRALPPRDPVRSPLLVALAGVALSFAVALAVGVLLELVDPVIVSAAQAEETLQLTVLGSVGRIG